MYEIVFDSKINNWKQNKSEFDKLIFKKQNLLFLIETNDGIKFGGFISKEIDKMADLKVVNNVFKWENHISDSNAFLFTFKDNNPMKFNIKKDKNNDEITFYLFLKEDDWLFQFGYHDIYISKQNTKSSIYQDMYCSFNYEGNENALIGKTGKYCFTPKRILVMQMK